MSTGQDMQTFFYKFLRVNYAIYTSPGIFGKFKILSSQAKVK